MKKITIIVICLILLKCSYSQPLCSIRTCSIDTIKSGIYKITSNLKPKSIHWIDNNNNIVKISNSIFYIPYDSVEKISPYLKRLNNWSDINTPPSMFTYIKDSFYFNIYTSENYIGIDPTYQIQENSNRKLYYNGVDYYSSFGLLYKYNTLNIKYENIPIKTIPNDFLLFIYGFNNEDTTKILRYRDMISEFVADTLDNLYFGNRYKNLIFAYNSKNKTLDSITYQFYDKYPFDEFIHPFYNNQNSNYRMQFKNIDTIILSDSCFLSFVDLKHKTTSLITKLSNEIIHFNIYGNKIYFINNFKLKKSNNIDSTEFYFYELDCITKKLDSNIINLAGKIDSTSFHIDCFKNIYCVKYLLSELPYYFFKLKPFKKYSNLIVVNQNSNISNILPKNLGNIKVHITSWNAESNLQLDCDGNIIFQGTYSNDSVFFTTPPKDSLNYYNEGYYKIYRTIEDTINYNTCQKIKAKVTFWNGEEKNVEWIQPSCTISSSKELTICDSFKFNKKAYYKSGIFTDTLVSSIKPDTIYTLNLIINKSKHDTLKAQTCNTFKFGDSTYSKSGTYTHKYNAKNGCDSFRTLILTSKEVTGKIKLENGINYTALTPNASYQWYYCYPWRRITNAQNQTFSTTTKGSYAVIVSSLGCTDTSDCVALYSSGIESLNQNSIQIFPNPIQDNFTIQFGNENKENSVEIYNALGQKIKSFNTKLSEIQVDMKNEAKGIYLLRINQLNIFRISKK